MAIKYLLCELVTDFVAPIPNPNNITAQAVIKYYTDSVQIVPTYNGLTDVFKIKDDVDSDRYIYIMDSDRRNWKVFAFTSPNANLNRPADYAFEKYCVNLIGVSKNTPFSVEINTAYNSRNTQIISVPVQITSASDHTTPGLPHALTVSGSIYSGATTDISAFADSNAAGDYPITGALVLAQGGATIRKSVHVGGAVVADGIVWEVTQDITGAYLWTKQTDVASEFKYHIHITGTDDAVALGDGALQVSGGASILKSLRIGTNLHVVGTSNISAMVVTGISQFNNVMNATALATGACAFAGGISIAKDVYIGGKLNIVGDIEAQGAIAATEGITITGDIVLDNVVTSHDVNFNHNIKFATVGMGIYLKNDMGYDKQPNIICDATNVLRIRTVTDDGQDYINAVNIAPPAVGATSVAITIPSVIASTSVSTGALVIGGGLGIAGALFSDTVHVVNTTDTSAIGTGAAIISGGLSVAKNIMSLGTVQATNIVAYNSNISYDLKTVATQGLATFKNYPKLHNNTTNSTTVLKISAGSVLDDTSTAIISLVEMTKSMTTWVVGTGNGMLLSTTTLEASMTYHIYAIYNPTTKISDVLAVAYYVTDIVLPTGYTYKKYIGSIITNSSSEIVPFAQYGNKFIIQPYIEVNAVNRETSQTYIDIQNVARGIIADAILVVKGTSALATSDKIILSNYFTEVAQAYDAIEIELGFVSSATESSEHEAVVTVAGNITYSRIYIRHTNTEGTYSLKTKGWIDYSL